jgi:LuxR family maltose regulon positive regulatory protein
MPRPAASQLRWSDEAQRYIFLIGDQAGEKALSSDRLQQISSFAFHSRWGMHFTARKQQVQRGGDYWYAYRRVQGRLAKRYLGKTADLTLARLEEIAHQLDDLDGAAEAPLVLAAGSAPPVSLVAAAAPEAPAAPPILLSKLASPRLPGNLLERPHLLALLDAYREAPLTLISAPAGFGKTTLVGQWMAARRLRSGFPPVAWLALEAADNDLLRFWRYLIAACHAFQVDLKEAQAALRALIPQPPFVAASLEAVLTALLNALAGSPASGILVLEDYHMIGEQTIQETVAFFVEHLPPAFRLVIITRSDPAFSLARLRALNRLGEIRSADLRFSSEEAAGLLQAALPFTLEPAAIQRLQARVQGWGAGLHLARLAIQRSATPAEADQALALFAQANPSVEEYFVNEVLDLQPEAVQQFVLETSMLPRLSASLCGVVTQHANSQDMLAALERANLFLEPLGAAPDLPQPAQQWYRYHALFAETMRREARRRLGDEHLRRLAIRAARWYEAHGFLHEAIDAALSAQDEQQAASWIARAIAEHSFPGEIYAPHTLRGWFEQLPDAVLEQHPLLCVSYAATLLFESASWRPDVQQIHLLERLLSMAESRIRAATDLPGLGELRAFRALLALRQGDIPAAIRHAEQALERLPQAQYLWRGFALSIVAEKWSQLGHLQQARAVLREAYALCGAVNNHFFQQVALIKLAQVDFELGEIAQAAALLRQALAEGHQDDRMPGLRHWRCVTLLSLAMLCYEGNDLESAYQHAEQALAMGQAHRLVQDEVYATLMLARVLQAQGQLLAAEQRLSGLLETIPPTLPALIELAQSALARLALARGDQIAVQRWAAGRVVPPDAAEAIEGELLIVRWLRGQGRLDEAAQQLEHLRQSLREARLPRRELEIQLELVLLEAARKQKAAAQRRLRDTLAQAFARNAQRLFLDAGDQMAILLRSLLPQLHDRSLQISIRGLLRAFPAQQTSEDQAVALIEPLSPQETRVLRLLAQQRSNADIAGELVVSVNTVRTQVQSIYGKLGVHSRAAASEVARELHLI